MNPAPAADLQFWSLEVVILIGTVGVLGSAFFSGCETGLMSTSRARLAHRQPQGGSSERLWQYLQGIEQPVLTCLIGTNLCVALTSAVVTTALASRVGGGGEVMATLVLAAILIVFGEILPKVLYREFPERLTLASIRPLAAAMFLFTPARRLLDLYSRLWERLLPGTGDSDGSRLDRRGMSSLLLAHAHLGDQDLQFRRSLNRFMELAKLDLGRVMQPFSEVVKVPLDAPVRECLALAARAELDRLPVIRPEDGGIAGWILIRDLLFLPGTEALDNPIPADLLRSPILVDSNLSPYELIEEFHSQNRQLAVVVDRSGDAIGLLAFEDLLDSVVGPIREEFDSPVAGPAARPKGEMA